MSKRRRRAIALAAILLVVLAGAALLLRPATPPPGVAVDEAIVPDPDDKPLAVRIWYPVGEQRGLPLIVISHGTGGSNRGHEDTAVALAQAGFVVAAPTHTGDNYRDDSYVGKGMHLAGRPRHVSRAIDHMLTRWPQHARIDPARIGLFGHSAGGFTGLVVAGGEPDMSLGRERCRKRPETWDCRYLKERGLDIARLEGEPPPVRWVHDSRVRAAVVAAPAVGYSFAPDRLAGVTIPIQLWEAGHDAIVEDSPAIIAGLLPLPSDRHIVAGAGHFSFLKPCDWRTGLMITVMGIVGTPDICAESDGFDRQAFHQRFNREMIAFFRKTLPPGC
jgi:predicted dienelactone hydrolase